MRLQRFVVSASTAVVVSRPNNVGARRCAHTIAAAASPKTEGKVCRVVDPRGFQADIHKWTHTQAPETLAFVDKVLGSSSNMLVCGSQGTGKLTILKAVGDALRDKKRLEVAFTSFDPKRAHRIDGILIHHLLGLRVNADELPIQEQLEGTLERHVRLVGSVYENAIYSIATCDVLVLDALHLAPAVIIKSLDAVCRRVRGQSNLPFGGLRVIASADFWAMAVHPGSDTGGYIFQLPQWDALFPQQYYLPTIHGQPRDLSRLTDAALMGALTSDDIQTLQAKSGGGATAGTNKGLAVGRMTPMVDTSKGVFEFTPRFPKQPFTLHNPSKATQIKRVEVGNFLINMLYPLMFAERFEMVSKLSLDVGSKAHLVFPLLKCQGSGGTVPKGSHQRIDVPAGVAGEVVEIHEHRITMSFPSLQRTVDIPKMRISSFHSQYPELTYHLEQFPLFPRSIVLPRLIIHDQSCCMRGVQIDGRRLADTNDLGNILSKMRAWEDFSIVHIKDYLRQEGVVHEPTRIYYSKLRELPVAKSKELWCKNCKGHIPTASFLEHWACCIASVRWCSECDATVPLAKLEAHMEKHQVVLCIDCGQAIEWKYWESHRLSCGPMMRELSADNEFLPETTRRVAIELGLDKRDLHTVKVLSKSMLPKSKKDVYMRNMQSI